MHVAWHGTDTPAVTPTPLPQVADGYRPPILPGLPTSVVAAIEACWKNDPDLRPNARGVVEMLQAIRDSGDVGVSGADAHIAQPTCCSVM